MARKDFGSAAASRLSMPSLGELPALSSTRVQNRFGGVLDELRTGGAIVIQRHDRPAAVLMSVEDFAQLHASAQADRQLNMLTAEFDALVARMQAPVAAAGLAQAFAASPSELAAASSRMIRASMSVSSERTPPAAMPAEPTAPIAPRVRRVGRAKRT